MSISPTVSIITVVYNSVSTIEATIKSVLNLSYSQIQYIVIDGGSDDGTLDIINKYRANIDIVISEPDSGIYHAMNKGIILCNGDWVNFMNSGDIFFSRDTINNVFENPLNHYNFKVIYGNHKVNYGHKIIDKIPEAINCIWKGMTIQHQSTFVKTEILKRHLFNTKYRFAADYDLFYYCVKSRFNINYYDKFISIVSANGFSESNSVKTYREFYKISKFYNTDLWYIDIYFKCLIVLRMFVGLIKKIITIRF